jgi:hypothetical protein
VPAYVAEPGLLSAFPIVISVVAAVRIPVPYFVIASFELSPLLRKFSLVKKTLGIPSKCIREDPPVKKFPVY